MTATEARAAVLAYHSLVALLGKPLPPHVEADLTRLRERIQDDCFHLTNTSAPARWARSQVGPVLAAALGAATWMGDLRTAVSALRVFGLAGEHALTGAQAWRLMRPYLHEPALAAQTLAEIRRRSGLRLHRLPEHPSPAETLVELTRPRSDPFATKVARWLAEYWATNGQVQADQTAYAGHYRRHLAELDRLNRRGELMQLTGAAHGALSREEWEGLIRGQLPAARLALRAGFLTTRDLVAEYWQRWQERPGRAGAA
jgi:hypothetical protein